MRCAACWAAGTSLDGVDLRRSITGIDSVPVMAWWGKPGAYFRVRDAQEPEGWRKLPALRVLAGLGLAEDDVRRLGRHALRDADRARQLLGEFLLFELWLAAFSLGVRTAEVGTSLAHGLSGAAGMSTPGQPRALATMALGAMRNAVPRRLFATVTAVLTPVVRDAVHGTRRGPRRPTSRPGAVASGPGSDRR